MTIFENNLAIQPGLFGRYGKDYSDMPSLRNTGISKREVLKFPDTLDLTGLTKRELMYSGLSSIMDDLEDLARYQVIGYGDTFGSMAMIPDDIKAILPDGCYIDSIRVGAGTAVIVDISTPHAENFFRIATSMSEWQPNVICDIKIDKWLRWDARKQIREGMETT